MHRQMFTASRPFELVISASIANPDIRALASVAGWGGTSRLIVTISAPLINTLRTGATPFPGGLRVNISASTRVGGVVNSGDALTAQVPVEINNLGILSGGGGRGGTGQQPWVQYNSTSSRTTG